MSDDDAGSPVEPHRCVVRCTPAEVVARNPTPGPFGWWPAAPLVPVERGYAVLVRSTHGPVTDPRFGLDRTSYFVRFLDQGTRSLQMGSGFEDDRFESKVEGAAFAATPDGLEAVFAASRPRERVPPEEDPPPVEVALGTVRFGPMGDLVGVSDLGTLGQVEASNYFAPVAISMQGADALAAIAVAGQLTVAHLARGSDGWTVEARDDAFPLPEARPVAGAIDLTLAGPSFVAVGGGAISTPGAMPAFGVIGQVGSTAVEPVALPGRTADPPARVSRWRDGFVVARHVRPEGDVSAGAIQLLVMDARGATERVVEVPTPLGIPTARLELVAGEDGEGVLVWLSRSADGAPRQTLHVAPLDLPPACELLDVEPTATLTTEIAPPIVAAGMRGGAVDLYQVGDEESWLHVESCDALVEPP